MRKRSTSCRAAWTIGRASGWNVCTSTCPGASRPLRPASCVISWNVRSSARKSGRPSPVSASTTAASSTPEKWCPFATICVPSSTDAGRLREPPQQLGQRLGAGDGVAVEPDQLELGQLARELTLELLCSRSEPGQIGRLAHRARRRRALDEAAVVAAQLRVAVQDERDVAVRAADRRAAGAAVERRRDAAPVEQQDRLATALGDRPQLGQQRRRQRVAGLATQVDDRAPAADRRRSGRRARGARASPSSRAAASRSRRRRRRPPASPASRRPCGRRSAGRNPACTRRRAPRRRRSARGRARARTPPSARRRRSAPRRSRSARARRAARRPSAPSAGSRRCRRSAPGPGRPSGARARSPGTRTIAPSPRSRTAAHACRYTSVFPLPVAPCSRKVPAAAVDRGDDPRDRSELRRRELRRSRDVDQLVPVGRRRLLLAPLRRLRCDERERAGRRRAVVVGEPERQLDERRRHLADHRLDRAAP